MEAAGVLNRLFSGDPVARRRNLYLRWVLSMKSSTTGAARDVPAAMPACRCASWCCMHVHALPGAAPPLCSLRLATTPAPSPRTPPPAACSRFAVLPIGEDNGIVEWVLNTTGLRHCLNEVYTAAGLFKGQTTNRWFQRTYEGAQPVRGPLGWAGEAWVGLSLRGVAGWRRDRRVCAAWGGGPPCS